MGYEEVEDLRIFQQAEEISDQIWGMVATWSYFTKDTVGKQLVRAADSVGSNIAEGYGRFHKKEVINFLYFARGSLLETRFWLQRAVARKLISTEVHKKIQSKVDNLAPQLNSFIRQRKRTA